MLSSLSSLLRLCPVLKPPQGPGLCASCSRSMWATGTGSGTWASPGLSQWSWALPPQVHQVLSLNVYLWQSSLYYSTAAHMPRVLFLNKNNVSNLKVLCIIYLHLHVTVKGIGVVSKKWMTWCCPPLLSLHRSLSSAVEYRDWQMSAEVCWSCRIR